MNKDTNYNMFLLNPLGGVVDQDTIKAGRYDKKKVYIYATKLLATKLAAGANVVRVSVYQENMFLKEIKIKGARS